MNKRELYRTAVVKQHVVTCNGVRDLSAGTVVGVQYIGEVPNRLYGTLEPMYEIIHNGMTWGVRYERNLTRFVL